VGIVSFGDGCGLATKAGVYTRVGRFSQWITATICAQSKNPPSSCVPSTSSSTYTSSISGNTASTCTAGGKLTGQLEISLDGFPDETTWTISRVSDGGHISSGPDFVPGPFAKLVSKFDILSGSKYEMTLDDIYGDGFKGSYAIYAVNSNGARKQVAAGPGPTFLQTETVTFAAPKQAGNGFC
jgi:hypothetical protein